MGLFFQLNSLPGKILFWASDWEFFWGNWEKRRIFWIGNGAYIRPLVIGNKGPASTTTGWFLDDRNDCILLLSHPGILGFM